MKKWISIAGISVILAAAPMTVWAGWEQTGGNYYYRQEDGSLAVNTTTPDGYLVGADGVWWQRSRKAAAMSGVRGEHLLYERVRISKITGSSNQFYEMRKIIAFNFFLS
ncbi:MAG: hypothetical protein ACI39W_00395 [Brotaphodocola sp.]